MLINNKTLLQLRLQSIVFYVLFIAVLALLAFLSQQHTLEFDWTSGKRNTLSEASMKLLATLDKPISATVFATEDESLRRPLQDLLQRYQRFYNETKKSEMQIKYVNPDLEPALVREQGITANGEIVLTYGERKENLKTFSEQAVTNALQRLARSQERWLVFLSGHGERSPIKEANHDLSQWVQQLKNKGFNVQIHNLAENPRLPDNTAVLIIASPQVDLLEGEVTIIKDYIDRGGQLLWLTDPEPLHGLTPLAQQLDISFIKGTIVDPTTQVFGISDPRFAIVATYPDHEITRQFETVTLYPQAQGIQITPGTHWQTTPIMLSLPRSWSETGAMTGQINFDKDKDIKGPLIVGLALQRSVNSQSQNNKEALDIQNQHQQDREQRVFVVGDGDFLSNAYLGNGGNMDIGLNIINWLSHDDQFINIPAKTAQDIQLELSKPQQILIAFGFLFILPVLLIGSGVALWWQRRKR